MTKEELAKYDGEDEQSSILLAIGGEIYDVSSGEVFYDKNGAYHYFAGKDASRSFITGCMKEGCPQNIDDLNEEEQETLTSWIAYYRDHPQYTRVGKLID
eukprot:CAMPEP_0117425354 /NCGR_PEP_ID=MMETSP0758-20121206/5623_1 /TAXON_ID=63605 /ORGANISM="Percolomonas cosmopolitus, Strain AE-1 (ATCC 50343)" /LENGTH=99 /DNA_ID=CAMNT_0005209749 /DNA_START=349 /DNA_END=648 /DNA_ORIENTATION=+